MASVTPVRRAVFALQYNNANITAALTPLVNRITVTDKLDGESDELEIEVDDAEHRWKNAWYPEKGATLNLSLGWEGGALLDCGEFTLDETEFRTNPDIVTLKALAASIKTDARTKRSKGYDNQKLADVAATIAARHGYTVVGNPGGPLTHVRLTQNNESDLAFLARLARTWGYVFTVKGKQLVFHRLADLDAAASVLVLPRRNMKESSLRDKADGVYRACQVSYLDPLKGELVDTTVTAPKAGEEGDTLILTERAESKAHAEAIGLAALRRSQGRRTEGTLTTDGDPRLVAGANIELVDMGRLNGLYQVKEARQSFTSGGTWEVALEVSRVPG